MNFNEHTCDICKRRPAVRWYGQTSAIVCGEAECSDTIRQELDAEAARLAEADAEWRAMNGR